MKTIKTLLGSILVISLALSSIASGMQIQEEFSSEITAQEMEQYTYSYSDAIGLLREGRIDEAISAFQLIIKADPEHVSAHVNLARAYLEANDYEQAGITIRIATELEPENSDAHHVHGRVYQSTGRIDDAITAYQRSIEMNPNNAFSLNNLGYAYIQTGRYQDAVNVLESAVSYRNDIPYFFNNLGYAFMKTGELEKAASAFEAALELNPDYNRAELNLSMVNRQLDKSQREESDISEHRDIE
jgi:type IV pilus biogenesis/stability protein PilW